jgi:hypothetical protein
MKRNYWYTGLSGWFRKTFVGSTGSGVRDKESRGRFIDEKKSTAEKNEAYEDGKTPADRNKRARTKKGKYKADDKSTKRRNEAYKGGKKPQSKARKTAAKRGRGRPKGSKNKKK